MESEYIKLASRHLASLSTEAINTLLVDMANAVERGTDAILAANAHDLERMDPADPKYDRLRLTAERISGIAADCRNVASLPSPLGRVLSHRTLPNGLDISRISVPFGVIGVIYEARPNVTLDVAALCLKAGSAVVLKGGSDAEESNKAICAVIHNVLFEHGLDPATVTLLPATREATAELLSAEGLVDLIIPRGSAGLIRYVRENSKVPVIETGAGVVHCYVDKDADMEMAKRIIHNAKCRRVSVCNALDCLLVHRDLEPRLSELLAPMEGQVQFHYGDFGREWLSHDLSIRVVSGLDEALAHIRTYGSGHSESIVTANQDTADRFLRDVDAACVYHNAPTSFTDGAQFGLGAEIGISTQKLHARGPMALEEITTSKYIIRGNGQTRG
ncbi:MAG: glutamate-5-semialdehyde dehydrogenase [Bacteroidaceae bacterium]|nr:glutamate-5-semialdehyde dehydrogenase [Bacteroidaceae bacterium]